MPKVSELLPRESQLATYDVITNDGDVRSSVDFTDLDGEVIETPDYESVPPALSPRDSRIEALRSLADRYAESLEKKSDKLGWSLAKTRAKYGDFPGAKELRELRAERDAEAIQAGAASVIALMKLRKQNKIYSIADPDERAKAQRDFDIQNRLDEEKKNRPRWDR